MKRILGICVCLLFSANVFAQQEQEVAPAEQPSNSVVDRELTVNAEQEVGTVKDQIADSPTIVDPMANNQVLDQQQVYSQQQVAPIQTMVAQQAGCGCQQTNYQAATPMIAQPYSNQVYSGNTFNRAPMQNQQVYRAYAVPQTRAYTSAPVQQYQNMPQQNWQYQQQYYAPQQQMVPVRRGLLFNRFRR